MLTQHITLDFTKKYAATIKVEQYETDGRHFEFRMTQDGTVPIDITDASVTLYATKPDATTDYELCEVLDGAAGKALFVMPSSMCDTSGTLACLIVISEGDETLRSPLFEITVNASPDIDGAAASTTQWTALEEALALVSGHEARITQNESDIAGMITAVKHAMYRVGDIIMSVSATNPAAEYGGTWVAWGAGRVPVGMGDNGTTNYDTVESTGGADSVTLTRAQLPNVNLDVKTRNGFNTTFDAGSTGGVIKATWDGAGVGATPGASGDLLVPLGDGDGHENRPSYVTCYMWKKTA